MKNVTSVIIPTYNEEKYIENCLRSVRNQKINGKIEIIIVDSNSSDRTREIAKKYANKVINIKNIPAIQFNSLGDL
jgi:glycosyltransferase involved in cell wall biosynthesis